MPDKEYKPAPKIVAKEGGDQPHPFRVGGICTGGLSKRWVAASF